MKYKPLPPAKNHPNEVPYILGKPRLPATTRPHPTTRMRLLHLRRPLDQPRLVPGRRQRGIPLRSQAAVLRTRPTHQLLRRRCRRTTTRRPTRHIDCPHRHRRRKVQRHPCHAHPHIPANGAATKDDREPPPPPTCATHASEPATTNRHHTPATTNYHQVNGNATDSSGDTTQNPTTPAANTPAHNAATDATNATTRHPATHATKPGAQPACCHPTNYNPAAHTPPTDATNAVANNPAQTAKQPPTNTAQPDTANASTGRLPNPCHGSA